MKKIVAACDSFKGSLTSREANMAVAEGVHDVLEDCEVLRFDMADGGEGTAEIFTEILGGRSVEVLVHDPLMRPMRAAYGVAGDTAVIGMSSASGLALVPEKERNPLMNSTFGTGEMILDALRRGCRKFIIGLGGSATNDGGTGMLSALGFRFLDRSGNVVPGRGGSLHEIAVIDSSSATPLLSACTFRAACDVSTPFCGSDGASFVFGPQKGASPECAAKLDEGMRSFAETVRRFTGKDIGTMPGTGAAGGLGGALHAFLGAELIPGAELILDAGGFRDLISGADLVITGEGCLDTQTVLGKAPAGVLKHCTWQGIPCIAAGGRVRDIDTLRAAGFCACLCITPEGMPESVAMRTKTASCNLRRAVREAITRIFKQ
ncbi:MAG: glycerate kinase [Candidatus Cryptobacteroides sp.]